MRHIYKTKKYKLYKNYTIESNNMERKRKKEKDIERRGKKKKRYQKEKDIKITTLIASFQRASH